MIAPRLISGGTAAGCNCPSTDSSAMGPAGRSRKADSQPVKNDRQERQPNHHGHHAFGQHGAVEISGRLAWDRGKVGLGHGWSGRKNHVRPPVAGQIADQLQKLVDVDGLGHVAFDLQKLRLRNVLFVGGTGEHDHGNGSSGLRPT